MRKHVTFVLGLILALMLTGCHFATSGPGRPIAAYIGDYVTTVKVTHIVGGQANERTVSGAEVDALRTWTSELEYKVLEVEEGRSPGDSDGGEIYDFVLTEGPYPGFSYIINGPEDCYLLIKGHWYSVTNPSDPPVD